MAKLPASIPELVDALRPAPPYHGRPAAGARAGEPDRVVKTHCCFCGQQCGIQLQGEEQPVVGFEPWEEFPFNHGKLCPKGVKRYLQDEHPDRLLHAAERAEASGFRPIELGRGDRAHGQRDPAASRPTYGQATPSPCSPAPRSPTRRPT